MNSVLVVVGGADQPPAQRLGEHAVTVVAHFGFGRPYRRRR